MSESDKRQTDQRVLEQIASDIRRLEETFSSRLRLQSVRDRYELYRWVTEITPDDVRAMRAGLHEFFEGDDLEKARMTNDEELARILFIQRAYEYLFYSVTWERLVGSYSDLEVRIDLWIRELGASEAFRVVHLRQGRYYPAFAKRVNRVLYRHGRFVMEEVERANAADARLKVDRATLKKLQAARQKQLDEARYMTETAFRQVVENLYFGYMERDLPPEVEDRLRGKFQQLGFPLILIDREEFTARLRGETDFLAGEIESGESTKSK
ncbi:MAG TPA: hypothetical protein VKM72_23615 [Thermoanaerobaculia bacterium]|nr:hypothetical protein [Thermoanaerobaculia bacterium]